MKPILSIALLFCVLTSYTQEKIELFRGGMFLHTGYVLNQNPNPNVDGLVTGIGGKITFRTGKHLRIGTEGYVSNYSYPHNEGQYELGWGGILTEYQINNNKLAPVLGLTFGGGKVHDLYVISGNLSDNIADETIYKVYSTFVVAPNASLEYQLTESINLVGKIDYIFYPGTDFTKDIAKGPRFYFGVLFMR